jgi:osmotically-inducible protein OsmY
MKLPGCCLLLAAFSITVFNYGCRSMSGESIPVKVPAAETPRDQALSRSVQARLLGDKKADLSGIKVTSSDGTVYLTGTVKSLEARQQAVKTAWEVRGVKSVVNSLEVQK